jgi:hypothetical protein
MQIKQLFLSCGLIAASAFSMHDEKTREVVDIHYLTLCHEYPSREPRNTQEVHNIIKRFNGEAAQKYGWGLSASFDTLQDAKDAARELNALENILARARWLYPNLFE